MVHAEEERLKLIRLQVEKQREKAELNMENVLKIAAESPVLFESAEIAYHALMTRYNSGLINYSDLILSQYSLARAEADMKKSNLDAWRALLIKAAAGGDLSLFLNQIPD